MLAIVRIVLLIFSVFLICLFGFFNFFINPRSSQHTFILGRIFGKLSKILGVKVIVRVSKKSKDLIEPVIYIGNHQSLYDMFIMSNAIRPNTITVGKKSLIFIPIFGQLYWIAGNILLDRNDRSKIRKSVFKIIDRIKNQGRSVWIFPEGTRSGGKGLLPFKNGAFRIASIARVPIIPVCSSEISDKIKLNRWRNGTVIVEILDPIFVDRNYGESNPLNEFCFKIMKKKISLLNREVN
ncbi:1-acylglycerol-3-phosphate O-acyltransferase [Candidatus Riesia pediculischaeffi]|uniref:1-acyl-sn-glycerol-3-phosphate acyltransferase n=1 Tax=Candidatus Riesia pediculischaeffi TaxID=428411 RepID=A0A1V0HKL3_9ENTR|nr:1-acylglycerol-3-phosphate O-acyltransferase [Candidatus Riesia pediculischaeffi]ARC53261.1 acyl-phosphate glycerol 3-phosphate acyltransferase [Candidatus Riesia pediculischaeffi]